MPALDISVDCYAATFASILEHFERKTRSRARLGRATRTYDRSDLTAGIFRV
jgi:hypothetical protein